MSICLSEESGGGDTSPQDFVTQRRQRDSAGEGASLDTTPQNFGAQRNQHRIDVDKNESLSLSEQFGDFKEEMRQLILYYNSSQKTDLAEITSALKEVIETNRNIESSVAYLTTQNEEYKSRIESLESQAKEDRQYIMYLEDKLEDLQAGSRKTNFELKNVPKKEKETKQDLIDMVVCLSETIDCKISKGDIKDIYRLRSNKTTQKNPSIIVETTSALLKADILKMSKSFNIRQKTKLCAKHLGFKTNEDTPVFLSEHLTAKGSRLHYLARDLAKTRGYKFCWTAYGKVYLRKSEQAPIILIKSENQVHSLLSQD